MSFHHVLAAYNKNRVVQFRREGRVFTLCWPLIIKTGWYTVLLFICYTLQGVRGPRPGQSWINPRDPQTSSLSTKKNVLQPSGEKIGSWKMPLNLPFLVSFTHKCLFLYAKPVQTHCSIKLIRL